MVKGNIKCKHTDCQRVADKEDNKLGYCNKCVQLNSKRCNYCQLETAIKCPKCHIEMEKMTNGRYIIDKCTKCKGIFLDGNELDNIKHISFFHYVKDYFRSGKHT